MSVTSRPAASCRPGQIGPRQAEAVLGAGGALWDHWQQIEAARYGGPRRRIPAGA